MKIPIRRHPKSSGSSSKSRYLICNKDMAFKLSKHICDYESLIKIILMILIFCIQGLYTDCPRLCECKWKSGKESVICLNANLSSIPLQLDAGTQVLDLTSNNVITIKHDEFSTAGLINLQKVYIAKCRLKTLDRYAFRHLINLVELDLSYNALPAIPSHTFDSIPELRELRLSGNPIQRIMNDAFMHVPQLVRLELTNCKIGTVESRAFFGLESSLEWLHLDQNRIVDIRSTTITSLQTLHGIELAGNPWNCSCTLRPLREWMLRHNIPYGIPPICSTPPRLADKLWDRLELDEFACAPAIEAYIPKAHGVEGRNVTMSCKIGGVPEPSVRWLLKNRVIANLSGVPYSNGKKLYVVHLQNQASNLTILTADMQDAGVYVCTAENKAGRAEASVTLAVSRRPAEGPLSSRLAIICVTVGIIFVLTSFMFLVCVCGVRKRQQARGLNDSQRGREESYEKIEMNNKVSGNRNNCPGPNNGNGIVPTGPGVVEVMNAVRRRGDYRGVPTVDTDVEVDEEDDVGYEDDVENTPTPSTTTRDTIKHWSNYNDDRIAPLNVSHWNNETSNLEADLHIPRRPVYMESNNRDDCKKLPRSTSGTFNEFSRSASGTFQSELLDSQHLQNVPGTSILNNGGNNNVARRDILNVTSNGLPQFLHPHVMRKQVLENNSGSLYTTTPTLQNESSNQTGRNYPDLLELATTSYNREQSVITNSSAVCSNNENNSLSYGRKQIENLHCTLPRKSRNNGGGLYGRASAKCHNSTDSEAPLLADSISRYSSSGGEDNSDNYYNSNRRFSVDSSGEYASSHSYALSNNRIGQRSNSFLNLSTDRALRNQSLPTSPLPQSSVQFDNSATPLLNINNLDSSLNSTYLSSHASPDTSTNANTYDYHAAQLERFLEEYRSLQAQLNKMKETCEGIRQNDRSQQQQNTTNSIVTSASVTTTASSLFMDPLLYNNVVVTPSGSDDGSQPKSILKNKSGTPTMASNLLSPLSNNIPDAASPLTLTPGDYGTDDPSPYWLPRNALLKRFNGNTGGNSYNFQS